MSVLPQPAEKASYVRGMFTSVAARYDVMNRLMTFGLDQGWRRAAVRAITQPHTRAVLDVGTGTGDFLPLLERMIPGATATGLDFTYAMLNAGRAKIAATPRAAFVNGDALALPFPDGTFDAITTGFTLRNVVDIEQAFAEMARVTRTGGRIACLEVARPRNPLVRWGHQLYFNRIVPVLGAMVGSDARAYTYLPQSASVFPPPDALAQLMAAAGWRTISWRLLGLGAVAIHTATRP